MVVEHKVLPFERGYYSKVLSRSILSPSAHQTEFAIWEQIIPPDGYIVPHYHEFDETLTLLSGILEIEIDGKLSRVEAPATILIRTGQIHSARNPHDTPCHFFAYLFTTSPKVSYLEGSPDPVEWGSDWNSLAVN